MINSYQIALAVLALPVLTLGCDQKPRGSTTSFTSVAVDRGTSSDAHTKSTNAASQPVDAFAVEKLFGLLNEWRARKSWEFLDSWASALQWTQVPDDMKPLLGPRSGGKTKAYLIRRDASSSVLLAVNTDDNSVGLAILGSSGPETVLKYTQEGIVLKHLGSDSEMGQQSQTFAAALPGERIGVLVITSSTATSTKRLVSVSLVDWRSAVRLVPRLESVFAELERPAKLPR